MILAIDIGTTDLKTALIDKAGNLHDYKVCPITQDDEIDPRIWVEALKENLTRPQDVQTIAICGNAPTLVPVDQKLDYFDFSQSVPKAQLWTMNDAKEEGRLVSDLCGHYIDPSFVLPKILRLKKENPKLYDKAVFLPGSGEFLCWMLCSKALSAMAPQGLEDWYWRPGWFDHLGLDASKMPPFSPLGRIIGKVSLQASRYFGFPETAEVLSPCVDFIADLCGSGVMTPSSLCDRMGTSEGLNLCTLRKESDPRLMSYRHPNGKYYNTSGIITNCGRALEKAKALIGLESLSWDDFFTLAQSSPFGSNGLIFLPYFDGERAPIWDPDARPGFFYEDQNTLLCHKARAICEAICLSSQWVIGLFQQSCTNITITGKPSESAFLCQLKADLSGLECRTLSTPSASLSGLGALSMTDLSIEEASHLVAKTKCHYKPNLQLNKKALDLMEKFKETYRKSKETV